MPPYCFAVFASSTRFAVVAKLEGGCSSAVERPIAPSSIACAISRFIASSSISVAGDWP